jgi:hypothetical protein
MSAAQDALRHVIVSCCHCDVTADLNLTECRLLSFVLVIHSLNFAPLSFYRMIQKSRESRFDV